MTEIPARLKGVALAANGACRIGYEDETGEHAVLVSGAHIGPLVNALAGAAGVAALPAPPPTGTVVGHAHLPVLHWQVGFSNVNREPLIVLITPGGIEQIFQIPAKVARDLGEALIREADRAAEAAKPGR